MTSSDRLYLDLMSRPTFIAGPCVIESMELLETVAQELVRLREILKAPFIFKASFDKANRTSLSSYRGPGLAEGLKMLAHIKETYDLPVTTDIHEAHQAEIAAEVVDILQIPAFLCRQTDLLLAAGETGRIVNIKKGQFLSGRDMAHPAAKVAATGNTKILLTERGNMYGYNNLIVDFRNIPDMLEHGYPVIMDCTHAVQRPSAQGGRTGGDRQHVPSMAMAAKAFGASGYFLEVHPDPDSGLSDGPNMLHLADLESLVRSLKTPR